MTPQQEIALVDAIESLVLVVSGLTKRIALLETEMSKISIEPTISTLGNPR